MAPTKKSKPLLTEGAMNSPTSHSQEELARFHELSAEMILQVLKYLPIKGLVAASGVCKKWRKLCKGASLVNIYNEYLEKIKILFFDSVFEQ